jgi:3-oxoacyl-[acyl-carrier protein] reductase
VGPGEDLDERRRRSDTRIMEMVTGEGVQTHWDVTKEMSDEAWHRVIGVHLNGTFFCTREALRLMSRRNRGAIVNLSSVAALMGLEQVPHYSAAKGGILAFTRQVAREVAAHGITVNAVAPGTTGTPRVMRARTPEATRAIAAAIPVGRLGTPEEIAEAVLFLASGAASFVTGAVLDVNGGQAMS